MEIANTSGQSKTSSKSLKQWIQQHPLFSYFFLAYAISWIVFIPYVLAEWGYLQGDYTIFYVLHVFGPALAAIIMISITAGRAGLRELRQSIRQLHASSKVVSVHPVGHSRIGHGWDHPPAGSVGKLSRSHNQHGSRLSVLSCCHILWSRTGRRTRLAWLCIAPYAKAIWFIMGNSISRRLVELLAFTRFSNGEQRRRTGYYSCHLPYKFPLLYISGCIFGSHHDMDLQSHQRQPLHRYFGTCQYRRSRSSWLDSTLSSREHDRSALGSAHQL